MTSSHRLNNRLDMKVKLTLEEMTASNLDICYVYERVI